METLSDDRDDRDDRSLSPRIFTLWDDRGDHLETSDRPNRPDRLNRLKNFLKRLGRSRRSGRSYGNQALEFSLHFTPGLQSAVCILPSVCILPQVCSLQSAVCSLRFTLTECSLYFAVASSINKSPRLPEAEIQGIRLSV